jgi:hypothetical protein
MDINEAKAKKEKAIDIILEKETNGALQWLMDTPVYSFGKFDVEERTGK